MKLFIAFAALLAVAAAKPGFIAPVAPVVPVSYSSQYHAQDELGQYSYGYADPLSTKSEVKSLDGVTRGGYSYVDAEGKLQSVQYTADAVNGFKVSASNLPQAPEVPVVPELEAPKPVQDTPEVAEAKAKHLEAVKEVEKRPEVAPEPAKPVVAPVVAPVVTAYAAPAVHAFAAPAVAYGYPAVQGFSYSTHNYAPYVNAYAAPYAAHYYPHFAKVFA